jgi:hypothetical protein
MSHLSIAPESTKLTEFGLCGTCGNITRVYDLELLKLYRAFGISNKTIEKYLPKLRQDFPTHPLLQEKEILHLVEKCTGDPGALGGDKGC